MISRFIREVYNLKRVHALVPDYALGLRIKEVLEGLPLDLVLQAYTSPSGGVRLSPSGPSSSLSHKSLGKASSFAAGGLSLDGRQLPAPSSSSSSFPLPREDRSRPQKEEEKDGDAEEETGINFGRRRFDAANTATDIDPNPSPNGHPPRELSPPEALSPMSLIQLLDCLVYMELGCREGQTKTRGKKEGLETDAILSPSPSSSSSSSSSSFLYTPSIVTSTLRVAHCLLPKMSLAQLVLVLTGYRVLLRTRLDVWRSEKNHLSPSFGPAVAAGVSWPLSSLRSVPRLPYTQETSLLEFVWSFESDLLTRLHTEFELSFSSSVASSLLPSEALLPLAEALCGTLQVPPASLWQHWSRLCVAYATGTDHGPIRVEDARESGRSSFSSSLLPPQMLSSGRPPWETAEDVLSLLYCFTIAKARVGDETSSSSSSSRRDGQKGQSSHPTPPCGRREIVPVVPLLGGRLFHALETFILQQPSTFWGGEPQREELVMRWEACRGIDDTTPLTPRRPPPTPSSLSSPTAERNQKTEEEKKKTMKKDVSSSSFSSSSPDHLASLARIRRAMEGKLDSTEAMDHTYDAPPQDGGERRPSAAAASRLASEVWTPHGPGNPNQTPDHPPIAPRTPTEEESEQPSPKRKRETETKPIKNEEAKRNGPYASWLAQVRRADLAALLEMLSREGDRIDRAFPSPLSSASSSSVSVGHRASLYALVPPREGERSGAAHWREQQTSRRPLSTIPLSSTAAASLASPLLHPVVMEAVVRRWAELLSSSTRREDPLSSSSSSGALPPLDPEHPLSATALRISLLLFQRLLSFPPAAYYGDAVEGEEAPYPVFCPSPEAADTTAHGTRGNREANDIPSKRDTKASPHALCGTTPLPASSSSPCGAGSRHYTLFTPHCVTLLSGLLNGLTDAVLGRSTCSPYATHTPPNDTPGVPLHHSPASSRPPVGQSGGAEASASASSFSHPLPFRAAAQGYRVGERENQQLLHIARGVMHHIGGTIEAWEEWGVDVQEGSLAATHAGDASCGASWSMRVGLPHTFLHQIVDHFMHHAEMRFVHRPGAQLELYTSTMLSLAPYGGLEVLISQATILCAVATGASTISRAEQILLASRLAKVVALSSPSTLAAEDRVRLREGVQQVLAAMMVNRHSAAFYGTSFPSPTPSGAGSSKSGGSGENRSSSDGWNVSKRWSKHLSPRDSRELLHVLLTLRFVDEGVLTGIVQLMREETHRFSTMDLIEHLHDLGRLGVKHLELFTAVALHVLGLESSGGNAGIRLAVRPPSGGHGFSSSSASSSLLASSGWASSSSTSTMAKELCLLLYTFTMVLKGLVKIVQSILSRLKLCAHQADLHDTSLALYSVVKLQVHRHVEVSRPLCDAACRILQLSTASSCGEGGEDRLNGASSPLGPAAVQEGGGRAATPPHPLVLPLSSSTTTPLRGRLNRHEGGTASATVSPAALASIWSSLRVMAYVHEPLLVATKAQLEEAVRLATSNSMASNDTHGPEKKRQKKHAIGRERRGHGVSDGRAAPPLWKSRELCSTIAAMVLLLSGAPPAYATPVEEEEADRCTAAVPSSSSVRRTTILHHSFGPIQRLHARFHHSPLVPLFRELCFRPRTSHLPSASSSSTTTAGAPPPPATTQLPATMFMDSQQLYLAVNTLRCLIHVPSPTSADPPPPSPLLPPLRLKEYAALAVPCNRLATTFSSGKQSPAQTVEAATEVILSLHVLRQAITWRRRPPLQGSPQRAPSPSPAAASSTVERNGQEIGKAKHEDHEEDEEDDEDRLDPLVQEMRTWRRAVPPPTPTSTDTPPTYPLAAASGSPSENPIVASSSSSSPPGLLVTRLDGTPFPSRLPRNPWAPPLPPRLWHFVCENWGKIQFSSSALREELRQSGVLTEFTAQRRRPDRHGVLERTPGSLGYRSEKEVDTRLFASDSPRPSHHHAASSLASETSTSTAEEDAALDHIQQLTAEKSTALFTTLEHLSSSSSTTTTTIGFPSEKETKKRIKIKKSDGKEGKTGTKKTEKKGAKKGGKK